MEEEVGFEPTVRSHVRRFSRPLQSTALALLQSYSIGNKTILHKTKFFVKGGGKCIGLVLELQIECPSGEGVNVKVGKLHLQTQYIYPYPPRNELYCCCILPISMSIALNLVSSFARYFSIAALPLIILFSMRFSLFFMLLAVESK